MNQEFNNNSSATNIQKVVPVKRNGYILELQLPTPHFAGNNLAQGHSTPNPQRSETISPISARPANAQAPLQSSLQERQVIINNSASQLANQQNNSADSELPEKMETSKFNNKLEQFKHLFKR